MMQTFLQILQNKVHFKAKFTANKAKLKDTLNSKNRFNFNSNKTNMLFQHSPPLFLKQIDSNKMVVLTKYRIIYAFIDKPLQSFYSILVEQNPLQLEYCIERKEALVVTERSVEVYMCDFMHEVSLKKVMILNEEVVYSVLKGNLKEWEVFGEIYQYSTKNLRIHSIEPMSVEEEAVSFCFIEEFELFISKSKSLIIYDHKKQSYHEIKQNQLENVGNYLKDSKKSQFKLKGFKLHVGKWRGKQQLSSIKESQSELMTPERSKKQKSSLFQNRRSGSQLYGSAAIMQENSRITNSLGDVGLFFLIVQLDSKLLMGLIPPQKYQANLRKKSTTLSQKNSVKGQLRGYVGENKLLKVSNLQTKWALKRRSLEYANSGQQQIIYSSTFRPFHHVSQIKAQQMIRTNQLSEKQFIEEVEETENIWILSKVQTSLIFSLIRAESNEQINNQSQIRSSVEDISKFLHRQSFMIDQNTLLKSSQDHTQEEFFSILHSLNQTTKDQIKSKPILELVTVQNKPNASFIIISFLYHASNTNKTLSSIKLKAFRLQDHSSKAIQTSLKTTKSTQHGQKLTISNPPVLSHNPALNSSESLSNLTPISGSQHINLTYSDDTQLTTADLLSRIPSMRSQKSQTFQKQHQKQTALSTSQKYKPTSPSSPSSPQNTNPLKQSRNRAQINSRTPSEISPDTKQFMQTIEKVSESRMNSYRPTAMPIKEVLEEQWNDESSRMEEEEVEEVIEVADFKPTSQNRSFGRVGSMIESEKSSKVVQKIKFDIPRGQHKRVLKKSSLQTYRQAAQMEHTSKNRKNTTSFPSQIRGLDTSLQNQTQEKQFYQKFINDYNSRREHSQERLFALKDSRDSEGRQIHNSKVSGDEFKKEKMQNMIGKDISEIVNGRNLRLSQDEDVYCSEEETVELGEEIEKQYSKSLSRLGKPRSREENAGQGLFSKHNTSVSCSEPTVILLDKLDTSLEKCSVVESPYPVSCPNDQSDLNHPKTPGFNYNFHHFGSEHLFKQPEIGLVSNDHWGNFSQKWNMVTEQQYNEKDELNLKDSKVSLKGSTFMRDSIRNLVSNKQFSKLSRKVQSFCNDPQKLTWDQARQIQAKKITQLMREMFVRSQQKFNSLMRQFLPEIIREEEARLFFAEYIRTFSGKTRDILVRLYMSLPGSEENRKWMSRALSEFKLSEVPEICLPVGKDILQVFKHLYPSVFIEDLLKPSIPLYQKLLQNYFALERLPVEQITIQDQAIDLSHPRNMLNILLYLNESYNLPMAQLFETYCTQMIKHDCAQIVVKMIKEEQTFDICEVSKTILEEIVETTIIQNLKESSANIQWVGKSLEILQCNISSTASKKKAQLTILLNVIDVINLSDCTFKIDTLFKLSQIKNLFVFCNTLIRQNSVTNLQKLNFPFMYRELHQIAYEQKLKYYNQQLKDLVEILCQKYFQNQAYRMAFSIIAPVIMITKRGFVAKMLFKYMEGKLLNRLANKTFSTKQEFMSIFKQFFPGNRSQRPSKQPSVSHDKFEFSPQKSYLVNCPYFKFYGMYTDCVQSTHCEQVIFVCYNDYQLASELATYHVLNKKEWQDLSEALNEYVPKEEIRKLVARSVFKFNSRVRVSEEEEEHVEVGSSFVMKDSEMLNVGLSKKSQGKQIKLLQAIEFQEASVSQTAIPKKLSVLRSKSDAKMPQQPRKKHSPADPIIQSLKYELNPQSVRETLKKLYQKKDSYSGGKDFLKALSMIDRQRLNICHYEKFKTVINLELQFEVEKLLPFEFFLTADNDSCYQLIKENQLLKKLSIKNFWTIYIVMEILLSKGEQIAMLMVEKLLSQFKSRSLSTVVEQILDKCRVSKQNLQLLAVRAQMEGEIQVSRKISQRLLNNTG